MATTRFGPAGYGIRPAGSFAGKGAGLEATSIATGAPTVGAPTLTQIHTLTAISIATGAPVVGLPVFGGDSLEALGIATGAPTVGAPTLSQRPRFLSILPPNATPFERSLEYPQLNLMEVPVPIRDLWRWDTCPVDLLPWLAWAMSVDLWDNTWPEQKKRAIIRDSFELHRRKGTLHAIERYLSFADATLRKVIVPPAKPFLSRGMTPEERVDWLARFPQLRVFRFRDRGQATYGAFASGGAYRLPKTFFGDLAGKATFFPYRTDAPARFGRRAFLWDRGPHFLATGEETPLRWIDRTTEAQSGVATDYEQALIPGANVQALFLGGMARGNQNRRNGRRFFLPSTAPTRIVSVRRATPYTANTETLRQFAVYPSLTPIQAFPEHVAERGTSKRGVHMFLGLPGRFLDPVTKQRNPIKCFLQGFVPETTAHLRLFDRLHLHDPRRLPDRRPRGIYLGHFRLGQPAFTAELSVEVRGKRTAHETTVGRFVYGFLTRGDRKPLELARQAVQRSKAHRDKILLKTNLHRTVTTADGITTESGFRSGDLIVAL